MNKVAKLIFNSNIISKKNIRLYSTKTRDNTNLKVYEDKQTGLIFIKDTINKDLNYYKNKKKKKFFQKNSLNRRNIDAERRFEQFKKYFLNKKILDFGSGNGDFVNLMRRKKYNIFGYEPQRNLKKNKFIFSKFEDINFRDFEIVTLFHVLEHLDDPIKYLKEIKKVMKKNSKIIIEVPHANDFLMKELNIEEFKNFTLWSEHYILHTSSSLKKFLKIAGFKNIKVEYFQRYDFFNHLNWLINRAPMGNNKTKFKDVNELKKNYDNFLVENKMTDTLIGICSN